MQKLVALSLALQFHGGVIRAVEQSHHFQVGAAYHHSTEVTRWGGPTVHDLGDADRLSRGHWTWHFSQQPEWKTIEEQLCGQ